MEDKMKGGRFDMREYDGFQKETAQLGPVSRKTR